MLSPSKHQWGGWQYFHEPTSGQRRKTLGRKYFFAQDSVLLSEILLLPPAMLGCGWQWAGSAGKELLKKILLLSPLTQICFHGSVVSAVQTGLLCPKALQERTRWAVTVSGGVQSKTTKISATETQGWPQDAFPSTICFFARRYLSFQRSQCHHSSLST